VELLAKLNSIGAFQQDCEWQGRALLSRRQPQQRRDACETIRFVACSPSARAEEYADWRASMRDRAVEAAPDCKWVLEHASWDKDKRTIACYGVASGTHTGPGGPVPATGRSVASEYVYILHVDETGRFDRMTLVWNAGWAMRELGWAS